MNWQHFFIRNIIISITGVAFTALKSASTSSDGVIRFENVLLNEGNGYNSATGEFTAPTDGVYVFSWTILTKETEAIAADLYLGSSRKARLFADARGGTTSNSMDDSASNTIAIRLTRGQKVSIRVDSVWDNFVDGNNWSSFSGHRIFIYITALK
ncbi:hypothetical protein KUTeg_021263 [Tegillarca granosa]|uniref:C1q domain-containing protein n=1 Tax=Tegillarca granosa TaxID=220873 RepID=A0ABQ9EEK3_TEGGR|nr:hypothetical protein KUTeg_021263 [Tegillarca granosa]